jgi:hypothetical protein
MRTTTVIPRQCYKCHSRERLECHHVCGRHHLPYLKVLLCVHCHRDVHVALQDAGVDLTATADPNERRKNALRAYSVFFWWLTIPSNPSEAQLRNTHKTKRNSRRMFG